MVRFDEYPWETNKYLYLIPKTDEITDDVIEKHFSENFQIGYLLNRIRQLEQANKEMQEKIVALAGSNSSRD